MLNLHAIAKVSMVSWPDFAKKKIKPTLFGFGENLWVS